MQLTTEHIGRYTKWVFNGDEWELVAGPEPETTSASAPAGPEGVSLLEAMQSGREFRPVGTIIGFWDWHSAGAPLNGVTADMLTARYELKPEPKKVEVTAAAVRRAIDIVWQGQLPDLMADKLINKLGLGPTDIGE